MEEKHELSSNIDSSIFSEKMDINKMTSFNGTNLFEDNEENKILSN